MTERMSNDQSQLTADFRDEAGARDQLREAAQKLFDLWQEYRVCAEEPEAEDLKESWNAGERACGVAAALMRLGYRIETHHTLVKVS
jgi:hypothetical protein